MVDFRCLDCAVDTAAIDEYYVVTPEVWARAGAGDGMLCIGCLEKRLGHRLDPADFLNIWMHWGDPWKKPFRLSKRLRARLGHGANAMVARAMMAAFRAAAESKARWRMAQPGYAEELERHIAELDAYESQDESDRLATELIKAQAEAAAKTEMGAT
jgi:hypothetical protein